MKTPFYYADDKKVALTPSRAFVAVEVERDADQSEIMSAVAAADALGTQEEAEVIESLGVVLVRTRPDAEETEISAACSTLEGLKGVHDTCPVFQMPNGAEDEVMVLIPRFRVQFNSDVSGDQIDKLNKKHGVEIIEEDVALPNNLLLHLTDKAKKNALELANLYHESKLTVYAEPDFLMKVRQLNVPLMEDLSLDVMPEDLLGGDGDVQDAVAIEPMLAQAPPVNDPFFNSQWALQKMRVPEAWQVTRGRPTIRIAVLDDGVQTTHPDLQSRIAATYDATQNNATQEPNSWDGHGTACAGIAAATANNGEGIAGVAPNCRIIAVRIAFKSSSTANWTTTPTWIQRGIIRAVQLGADVLSNSWGGGGASTIIRQGFQYARASGRGGRGSISIAATGNGDLANAVLYPAKYPEVLACGASNQWDRRKSKTSQDGEHWWGSNYGPEVDFVAPGVNIHTTDLTGSAGYSAGNYVPNFNGTSSATPNAAGVAALVLSVDPRLRQWEVRDILRLTARDLQPSGHDPQHGFGRIDAAKAVAAAQRLQSQVRMRLEFLGVGQECFMRFLPFQLLNCGLNRVRVNGFTLRSYDPAGTEIDRFEYIPRAGGIMQPGLSVGGGAGGDLRFNGILLKAHGNRRKWSYRWRANWSYTFWRPSTPLTTPADAMVSDAAAEEAIEEQVELVVDSREPQRIPAFVRVEIPRLVRLAEEQPALESNGAPEQEVSLGGQHPVTITIKMG